MAGATINPHSVKKYHNGKSGLLSGAITLQPNCSFLNIATNTTIQEFVDWMDFNKNSGHQSLLKTMFSDKFNEVCRKLSFHVENEKWESKNFGGIQSISITKETGHDEMMKWILQMPRYEPYETVLIDGIKNFIAITK